jgi:hypothetical protein
MHTTKEATIKGDCMLRFKRDFSFIYLISTILVSSLFVVGCASYIPMAKTDTADPMSKSFLFGHFQLTRDNLLSNVGLDIKNIATGAISSIAFSKDSQTMNKLLVMEPGAYKIENWFVIYTAGERGPKKQLITDFPKLTSEFTLKPGEAMYIGSYKGLAKSETVGTYIYQTVKITDVYDDYEKVIAAIKSRYKYFDKLKKVNLLK